MIVAGLTLIGKDFVVNYIEREQQKRDLQNFMNAPQLSDDEELPEEATTGTVWGTIEIEKLDVNHLIMKSDDWSYLNRYVVAWERSVEPPLEGNFSIAGHNGRCASCVFRNFDKLENGDEVKISNKENTFVYKIYNIDDHVHYTDTSVLEDTPGKTTLTLVTCTEQSTVNPWRTIVKAELVEVIPLT
ncbi:MAG: sortase [Erysipelothrix sp.]